MNIFLRYEITSRELDANILTGLVAASRGHRAIVCDWPMMMRGIFVRRRQSGFVHMNSLVPETATLIFHKIFVFFGYQISSMDQEAGIQRHSYESFANSRFGEASVSGVDLIFCWGKDDFETLRKLYPSHKEKFIMSGSPRADLWRPKFSSVYTQSKKGVEPKVVIVSSVLGPLLVSPLHEILISLRKSGYFDRNPEMETELVGVHTEGTQLMLSYLELVRSLDHKYEGLTIVVSPHPSENPEIWRGILGRTNRVIVDSKTPTSQLIRESVAVITSGSTAAFEAELSETPLISFQPIEMPHRNLGFADGLGSRAKTVEEVHTILRRLLYPSEKDGAKLGRGMVGLDLRKKIYSHREQLAAERMVDSWEGARSTESNEPDGDSILSMPREELRYFVASAFPFLIPLFTRKGKTTLRPFQKSYKRPPLDRKLVKARIDEIRSILGLEGSVSYRFRGRRGLIIEPSLSSGRNG